MEQSEAWKRAQQLELAHWREGFANRKIGPSVNRGELHSRLMWDRFDVSPNDWRGESILDVGCGPTARLECFFARSCVYGMDSLVHEYLGIPGAKMDGYEGLFAGSAEKDDWEHSGELLIARFGVVVCLNVLDHCDKPQKALDNMLAYCKPGGIGVVSVDCTDSRDAMHPHAFQPQDVERMILDAEWTIAKRARGRSFPVMENGEVTHWLDGWTKTTMAYHWWLRKPRTKHA